MSIPHTTHPRRTRRVPTLLIVGAALVLSASAALIVALTVLFKLVAGVVS